MTGPAERRNKPIGAIEQKALVAGMQGRARAADGEAADMQTPIDPGELRLLSVIDQLPDGYALYDADEHLVFWNERYLTCVPNIRRPCRSGDGFEALIRDQVEHGAVMDAIGQEEAWIGKRLKAFRDPGNLTICTGYQVQTVQIRHIKTSDGGTLLIVTDVTEAKDAERELRTYASVIDQVTDRVAIIDGDYRYIFVNEACVQFHQRPRSDFIGRHLVEVLGDSHFEKTSKADIDRCLAGDIIQTQRSAESPDGRTLCYGLTLKPFRDDDGKIVGAIVVIRDITESTYRAEELQLASSMLDQLSERVLVFDTEERVRFINQSCLEFHGFASKERAVGKLLADVIGKSHYRHEEADLVRMAVEDGIESRHDYWRKGADGESRFWETSIVPFRESDQTITGAITTSRDMTEHRLAERARQRFQDAIEYLADGYALFDEDERLVACNRYYQRKQAACTPGFALGISFEAIIRGRVACGTILDAIGREEAWIAKRLARFRSESHIDDFRETGGRWSHVRSRRTADGGTLLMVTDITESKRIEEALAESQSRFKDFTELAADWFWEQDVEGRYTYVSESIEMLTRQPVSELLGKDPTQILTRDFFQDPTWHGLWRELRTTGIDRTVEIEHDLTAADGRAYRVRSVIRPMKNAVGVIVGYRGAAKDITEAHRLERKLEFQAHHDALTGLLNRRSFERHLEQAIEASGVSRRSSVFCFIDLDQFKIVNDTIGHLAGDRLLRQVAEILSEKVRKADVLARLGGDEFGLLLHDCSLRRAQNMAKTLLAALNSNRFIHEDNIFEIGACIGLTSIKASHGSVGEIMAEADLACYAAKDEGRNRVQVYQDDDRRLNLRRDEMSKASLIRGALDEDRFILFTQPIVPLAHPARNDLRSEILLRMVDADDALVAPGNFIPAAERYGLMVEIDRWVIRQSFAMLSDLLSHQPNIRININLSGLSLNEDSLVGFIMRLFGSSSIAPESVCFEITETAAIRSLSKTRSLIGRLKRIGCRFALDDFGSGLSSFSYLKQLPVDYLKIDGSFIRDILSDERSRTMVEAIHQVAKSLGLETVAECVETEAAAETLRTIGIDFAQGTAIGRPEPLVDLACLKRAAV